MIREHPIAVIDTNIWLDNYLGNRPGTSGSHRFIQQAHGNNIQLAYPVHILKDVFFLIQAHLKEIARKEGRFNEEASAAIRSVSWGCIGNMRELATAIGADESDAWMACKYRSLTGDLEDNFVLAAAERAQADCLVTRDDKLLRKATVTSLSPEDALVYFGLA